MAYGIIEKSAVMAQNVDSLNRNVESATILENGFIGNILTWGTDTNLEGEVGVFTAPATGALTNLWMLAADDVVTTGNYRNLNPDVRDYRLAVGRTGSVFQPKLGDIVEFSADAFSAAITTETHVNATDATWQLVPGSSQTASVLSFIIIRADYFSFGLGSLGTQRITSYICECVGVA